MIKTITFAALLLVAGASAEASAQNIAGAGCKAVQSGVFPQKAKDLRLAVHGLGYPEDGSLRIRVSDQWSGILCFPADHPLRATAIQIASKAFETHKSLILTIENGAIVAMDLRQQPTPDTAKVGAKVQAPASGKDEKPARVIRSKPTVAPGT